MQIFGRSSYCGRLSGLGLLLLSTSWLAVAAPLTVNGTLAERDGDPISLDEFVTYLQKYFTATGDYYFYSGGSDSQAYNYFETQQVDGSGYWAVMFDEDSAQFKDNFGDRNGDVSDSSKAMAMVATGDVLVFGAVEYQTKGQNSGFALWEVPILHDRLSKGEITSIKHMQQGATSPDEVLATEDADGKITYVDGQSGPNASGGFSDCSSTHDAPTCDQ